MARHMRDLRKRAAAAPDDSSSVVNVKPERDERTLSAAIRRLCVSLWCWNGGLFSGEREPCWRRNLRHADILPRRAGGVAAAAALLPSSRLCQPGALSRLVPVPSLHLQPSGVAGAPLPRYAHTRNAASTAQTYAYPRGGAFMAKDEPGESGAMRAWRDALGGRHNAAERYTWQRHPLSRPQNMAWRGGAGPPLTPSLYTTAWMW